MKKIVIKNKFRFICFLLVMFTLISVLIVSTLNLSKVYSKSYDTYISYYVESGDTLWNIANENNSKDKDLRDFVHEIKELNNIDANLYIGQKIIIPM